MGGRDCDWKRNAFSRYVAPLTYLIFEPLSKKLSLPDYVYSHAHAQSNYIINNKNLDMVDKSWKYEYETYPKKLVFQEMN